MNHDTKFQLRLPLLLYKSWTHHFPPSTASAALRIFMNKALETIRKRPRNVFKLLGGEYVIKFTKEETPNERLS